MDKYTRLKNLQNLLYRKRRGLNFLYKVENVCYDVSDKWDIKFDFLSRYGKAEVYLYPEKNYVVFKYCSKESFELRITKEVDWNSRAENRIQELEQYLYSVYGMPKKPNVWRTIWKRIKKWIRF